MATVPAVRFLRPPARCVIAVLVAAVGALATVGFEPVVNVARFEYVTLGLALPAPRCSSTGSAPACTASAAAASLIVLIGSLLLAVTLAYAELLRRYGTPGLVDWLLDAVAWRRDQPRRVPAPARGRARHPRARLGHATCGPGAGRAGGSAPSASPPPPRSRTRWSTRGHAAPRAALAVLYGVVVGLVIGFIVIRPTSP